MMNIVLLRHFLIVLLTVWCIGCGVNLQDKFNMKILNGTLNDSCYTKADGTNEVHFEFPMIYDSKHRLDNEEIKSTKKKITTKFLIDNLILFSVTDLKNRKEIYSKTLEYDFIKNKFYDESVLTNEDSPWQIAITLPIQSISQCEGDLELRIESVKKDDRTEKEILFQKIIRQCVAPPPPPPPPPQLFPMPRLITDNVITTTPDRIKINSKNGVECEAFRRRILIKNLDAGPILDKGEILFSGGYFVEEKLLKRNSIEREALSKVVFDVGNYLMPFLKDRYIYFLIEGSADNDVKDKEATLRNISLFSELEKEIFRTPIYVYKLIGNQLDFEERVYETNRDGCSNKDLPNLRSSFIRYILTGTETDLPYFGLKHEPEDKVFPVGIINGKIDPNKGSEYRTISIYILETQCPLIDKNDYPRDFEQYFR